MNYETMEPSNKQNTFIEKDSWSDADISTNYEWRINPCSNNLDEVRIMQE